MSRRAWAILAIVLVADIMDLLDSTITTIAAPTIFGSVARRARADQVARLAQGAFGALLIPHGFGILGSIFPRAAMGKAFSAFGPVLGLSAVGRPLLAAVLIDADLFGLSWRPMFLINIVLGVAGLAAASRLLPRDHGDAAVTVDVAGAALLAGCMLGLLDGLIRGSTDGWTAGPIAALAAGVACFAVFCQRQRTAAAPLIKPSLLRNRGFTAGPVMGVVFFAAVAGLVYAISLFLQRGLGDGPLRAAVTGFAPMAAGIVVASVLCMNLITRLGRTLSLAGIAIAVAGTGALLAIVALDGNSASTAVLAPAMAVIGSAWAWPSGPPRHRHRRYRPGRGGQCQRLAQLGPATRRRTRPGHRHQHLLRRPGRRAGARDDRQPARGDRHRRRERPGRAAAAAQAPGRRGALRYASNDHQRWE